MTTQHNIREMSAAAADQDKHIFVKVKEYYDFKTSCKWYIGKLARSVLFFIVPALLFLLVIYEQCTNALILANQTVDSEVTAEFLKGYFCKLLQILLDQK